jgi:hypothetical protein
MTNIKQNDRRMHMLSWCVYDMFAAANIYMHTQVLNHVSLVLMHSNKTTLKNQGISLRFSTLKKNLPFRLV